MSYKEYLLGSKGLWKHILLSTYYKIWILCISCFNHFSLETKVIDRKALIPDTIQGVISAMCFKTVQITAEEQGGKMNNRRDNR